MSRSCRGHGWPAVLTVAVLAAGLAGPAGAAPSYKLTGYGDFRFGMSVAEAATVAGAAQPAAQGDGAAVIEMPVTVAGLPALRRLLFADDRLVSILFRWELAADGAADGKAQCRALYDRLHGQLAGRYGRPALGPHPSPAGEPGFAGASFWSFADAASIGLVVVQEAGRKAPCRATLNYKEPPAG